MTLRLRVAGAVLMLALAAGPAPAQETTTFDGPDAPAGWTLTGDAGLDASRNRSAEPGAALRLGPGSKAVRAFRDADGAGRVELWVWDDLARPADPKAYRVGPRWGLLQADGRALVLGVFYARYLGGDTTYATCDYDGKTWFNVQYSRLKRQPGWHKWTFDFDPDKGLTILCDDKQKAAFDWNRTKMLGFSGVVLYGDSGGDAPHTVWVDDVTIRPGGPMKVQPVPPPPPPPVVPDADPPAETRVDLVPAVRDRHPRLLFTADDVPALRQRAGTPAGKRFVEQLLAYLPSSRPPDHTNFLTDATDAQRQGMWRLPTVALHYVLTGDRGSFEAAAGFLRKFLDLENWETGKERDCGMGAANILVGAALAYDWLHGDLDPAFREAMRRKLLLQARRMYHAGHLAKLPGTHYWQPDPQNNHRWHRDAGLALAVLAVAGDGPEDDWLLAETARELAFVHAWLPEDGSCHESPSYMVFGGPYLALAMDAADRCLGTRYLDHPFFRHGPLFRMHTLAPGLKEAFAYGDGGGLGFINNYFFLYTARHRLADLQAGLWRFFEAGRDPFQYGWFSLLWFDPTLGGGSADRLPRTALFPDLGIASLRDGWADGDVAVLFKCGPYGGRRLNQYRNERQFHYINVAHDDPDANSFVLFAGGRFLAEDDRYAAKKLTASHNTLLVNGKGQKGEGQGWTQPLKNVDMAALATVTTWKDTADAAVVEGEAGGLYVGLERFRRTLVWVPRGYVLVLDDLRAAKEADLTWLVQGPEVETLGAAGGAYRLAKDGARCDFRVVADREFAARVADSPAEHRGKPLGYRQVQLSARATRWRLAAAFNPWNLARLDVALAANGDQAATVTVSGPDFTDTWRWQAAPDTATPATLEGRRAGGFAVTVGPADRAPLGGPPVAGRRGGAS